MQADPVVLDGDSLALPASTHKPVLQQQAPLQHSKHMKAVAPVPRLDYEPIYAELKAAVGGEWASYKESVTLFLLGYLNQREFSSRVDHILLASPKTARLHNHFICAIISNLTRELPDHGVASWVSANDKPSAISKPITGDATERRLKTEVMQLQPKDRRRLKAIPKIKKNAHQSPAEELQKEWPIRFPDQVAANTGKLSRTNWEVEVRKRYDQRLASEIGEFPDAETIKNRIVPICYEESIFDGPTAACAPLMAIATENFVKDFLSTIFSRTRLNGPSGTINRAMTRRYRLELEEEKMAFTLGDITKNTTNGLLPVEAKEASTRKPLSVRDMKLTLELGGGVLGHMPLVANQINNGYLKEELEAECDGQFQDAERTNERRSAQEPANNENTEEDDMDWEGADPEDKGQLESLLDDCLSAAF
ncbi:transcriptional coactivator hfi1/ADA1 [Ascosphaera pollenicola]|nr:transcriptional coactivator hfi1/ADA1 [Ascosphaera pollenicola]